MKNLFRKICALLFFFSILILVFGCEKTNNAVIKSYQNNDLSSLIGKDIKLSQLEFDDWAYPSDDILKVLFPGEIELHDLGYNALKYHGVKFILRDFDNIPWEYDESDDSYLYHEPQSFKVIAFFKRTDINLENYFKRLYNSDDYVSINGRCIAVFPSSLWTDVQIQEDTMLVILLNSVHKE